MSCLFTKGDEKVVFKFLIQPRNEVELERFKLEFSVLEKNILNQNEWNHPLHGIHLPGFPPIPKESYPLPKIKHPLALKKGGMVNYFSYKYEQGTLLSDIDTSNYSLHQKFELLHRLASGLFYFNLIGYSHRDLHPENILLNENPQMVNITFNRDKNNPKVKILDLGSCQKDNTPFSLCSQIPRDVNEHLVFDENNKRLISSFISMPPDFLEKGEQTENYDTWSFGIYAYKLITEKLPDIKTIEDVTKLRDKKILSQKINDNIPKAEIGLKLILKHLLSPKGNERPKTQEIVRLFSWLVFRHEEFQDEEFVKQVIHNEGFDPHHDPIDDIY